MWKMCLLLITIFKRILIILFFASFIISVCYLQRQSFISGRSEVKSLQFSAKHDRNLKTFRRTNEMNRIKHPENVHVSNTEEHSDHVHVSNSEEHSERVHVSDSEEKTHKQTDVINKLEKQHPIADTSRSRVNKKLLKLSSNTRIDTDLIDIMGQPPIKFLPTYKNPCFIGNKTNQLFNDNHLHCLPYFYLIGVKKSGTTDLFHKISTHPDFRRPGFKEAQWFPRMRFGIGVSSFRTKPVFKQTLAKGIDNRSIKYYISLFDTAAKSIKTCSASCITAEGTPANLHMHTRWDVLPGNEGLTEPRYTNFHYIKHITPDAKIIIIFRDPVSRLFSDFMHEVRLRHRTYSVQKLKEMFHRQASILTQTYETCFKTFSTRRCIYNNTLSAHLNKEGVFLADSFRAGFYAFYMRELFSVFRRNQILPILMTDYLTKTEETLANTFRFLDISPLSAEEMSKMLHLKVANSSKNKRMSGAAMRTDTKDILYNFYTPFNRDMAELMKDRGYIFSRG